MSVILEAKHISKNFGLTQALIDVSVTIDEGEVIGLIGENGSGKTTLLSLLGGLDIPTTGIILYENEDIKKNNKRVLRYKGKLILIVHHDLSIVPHYFDQVILLNRKLIASGPTNLVFNEDKLRKTYGNSLFYKGDVNDF